MVKDHSVKELTSLFSTLQKIKVLLLGDYMLDRYTQGEVSRVSPEAPVPVLKVESEKCSPGGAGNVALNLLSLGLEVFTVGRIGRDQNGKILRDCLTKEGANTTLLMEEDNYFTSVKNRFLASNQQIFRADFETVEPISEDFEADILKKVLPLIPQVAVVAFSDYGKGFLSNNLLKKIIGRAQKYKKPIIVDPKGIDFKKYSGATIIKPNLGEAYAAAKLPKNEDLEKVAKHLLKELNIDNLFITRSEKGISIFQKEQPSAHFPAISKEVKDVTGAGDTVLAMLSFVLGNGLNIYQAAQLSNIAAGIAIERVGCAKVGLADLASKLLDLQSDNKIFDGDHLFVLKMALKNKKFSLVSIEGKKEITTSFFVAIKKLAASGPLVLYLLKEEVEENFVHLLSSLKEVSFIILGNHNFEHLCQELKPNKTLFL